MKHPSSIRLSATGKRLRDKLAAILGVNKTAVIELAIRSLANKYGVKDGRRA